MFDVIRNRELFSMKERKKKFEVFFECIQPKD